MTMWVQARSTREVVLALNLQGPGEIKEGGGAGPQLTGSRQDQEEGGGDGPCS